MSAPRTPLDVAALARSILDTHHALLKRELPPLELGLRDAPDAVRVPFVKLRRLLDEHLMKEEMILFPAILSLAEGRGGAGCGVQGPIAQMGVEHERIRALEEEIRMEVARAGNLGPDLLRVLNDLDEHARKEDEWLFPAAIRLSSEGAGAGSGLDDDAPPAFPPAARAPAVSPRTPPPTAKRPASSPTPAAPPASAPAAEAAPRRKHVAPDAPPVTPPPGGRVIRQTRGMCPTCRAEVPASVVLRDGTALFEKRCPLHGASTVLLSRHPDLWSERDRFWFAVMDDPARRGGSARPTEAGDGRRRVVGIAGGRNPEQVGDAFRSALRPENAGVRELRFVAARDGGSGDRMPDAIVDLLCEQVPTVLRRDVHAFELLCMAMLSAFGGPGGLYEQHYLVARDGKGGFVPVSALLDPKRMAAAAVSYSTRRKANAGIARLGLRAALVRESLQPATPRHTSQVLRLGRFFARGAELRDLPEPFLLLTFAAPDGPATFDAAVGSPPRGA